MPIATAATLDTGRVLQAVRARLACGAGSSRLLERYLEMLVPTRWTIEWYLPWWLVRRFRLPEQLGRELVAANVLGLLGVRLADDITDGDIPAREVHDARALSDAALDAALDPYRRLFPEGSPFWTFVARSMLAWRAGADGPDHARRAEPIKIAAYACCLVADRIDAWPRLEGCLEHAMAALVLYDQFFDWEADVAARRWNAFVAGIVGDARPPAESGRIRAAVFAAMLSREVVPEHFRRIAREADLATRRADALLLGDLASFLRAWARDTAAQGVEVATHYRRAADQATRLLFPIAVGAQG